MSDVVDIAAVKTLDDADNVTLLVQLLDALALMNFPL